MASGLALARRTLNAHGRVACGCREIAVWIASLLEFVVANVLIFVCRQWWRAWIAALLAASAVLFVLYARQPIWTGALLQVPMLASIVWAWRANRRGAA